MVMTYSATEKTGEQDYQGNVATYIYDRSGRVITANAPISGTLHYQSIRRGRQHRRRHDHGQRLRRPYPSPDAGL